MARIPEHVELLLRHLQLFNSEALDSLGVTSTMEDFGFDLGTSNHLALRDAVVEVPTVMWEDIGGLNNIKQESQETVYACWVLDPPNPLLSLTGRCIAIPRAV